MREEEHIISLCASITFVSAEWLKQVDCLHQAQTIPRLLAPETPPGQSMDLEVSIYSSVSALGGGRRVRWGERESGVS